MILTYPVGVVPLVFKEQLLLNEQVGLFSKYLFIDFSRLSSAPAAGL